MSLVLHPQKSFTVVRQITNHLDTDTNYDRAVIRNAYTDALIDTLSLTDRGSQRFSSNWQVPADPSGEGFYVSIVTSVYTDSGYTTKNPNYGDEESTYLVEDKVGALRGGGGGGVDSRTIRRIISEELDKREPEEVEEPEEPEEKIEPVREPQRWDEIISAIGELKTVLAPKEPEKVDLQPLFNALDSLRNDVREKEVTPETDLTPILDRLGEKDSTDELTRQEIVELLSPLNELIATELPKKIGEMLGKTTFGISLMPTTLPGEKITPNEPKKEEVKPFDLSNLSL